VGAAGDMSDFQQIMTYLTEISVEDQSYEDGATLFPKEIHSYLGRVLYNKRNKMDPFWNELVVAGFRDGKAFLGAVDLHGTTYEENIIANGMGLHLAVPLLRKR
jgi:20S proteasome subunit beta 7